MFCSILTKLFSYVGATKSSSDPKYDIDTTQNISSSRSKKLYEVRTTISKYTPRSFQLLESSRDWATKSFSDPKYDIDTTQNISNSRSKKLYEVRTTISKYTPRSFQLLESSRDFSLLFQMQIIYQHVTIMIFMVLGHLPYLCPMLGPNFPFMAIIT
jgi:hypothetical protein